MPDLVNRQVRQVTEPVADHGEGPVWDARRNRLIWLDMLAGDLLATDPTTGRTERYSGPEDVAAVLCQSDEDWLLAGKRYLWRGTFENWQLVSQLPLAAGERTNEGGCAASGELYLGTMREDETVGGGAIYRYDGIDVRAALTSTTISNGMVFSSDGVWFIDSPTHEIRWYSIHDDGRWIATDQAISTREFTGIPDGMCRDTDGGFWVAMYGGSAVVRFTAAGSTDVVIDIPAGCPTSCCFGGNGGRELYVTTSRYRRDTRLDPNAGALFAVQTNFQGARRFPFSPA
ncbi:SMP-30/gluconolactonase/LRE family protein [Streptomyces sp. NBC_00063]|uniref:SMP-30/gluconolactonase/LRE family protein n=1 Tax=Streptomyces sp. NBC_00063 TaxID=2975638 RepID=UPI003D74785D